MKPRFFKSGLASFTLALTTALIPIAAMTICATSAHAQSGSATWTGAVDGDYFNGGNWSTGSWPNGNATFSGDVNTTVTHTAASGESPYVFGLRFTNTLTGAFTIGGAQQFNLGGSEISTSEVTAGSLTAEISVQIALVGSAAKVITTGANHDLILSGPINNGGASYTFTKVGAGMLTLSGTNGFTAPVAVNAGTLQLGDGGSTGSLLPANAISVAGGATFSINQNDTVTQGIDFSSSAIAGNGTFDVKGGATVVLTDAATFADTLVVTVASGSTLDLDFAGTDTITSFDDGSGFVAAGVWGSGASGAPNVSAALTGSGTLTVTSSGPPKPVTWDGSDDLTWNGPSDSTSWSGATYNNADFATFGDTGAGAVAITGTVEPGSVTVDSANDYTFSGAAIGGISTLGKAGAGKLTLDSANTYTGVTTITGGQIQISTADALGSTAGETIIGASSKLAPDGDMTIAEPITNQGGGGGKIQSVSGTQTFTAPITLEANMDIRGNDYVFQGGFTSASNSAPGFNGSNYIVETTPITVGTGTFGLTSAGNNAANTSQLNVAGNVWGLMRINFGGYLTLGVANALPAAAGVEFGWVADNQSSGALSLNGFDQTIGFLRQTSIFPTANGDHQVTGGGTLTIDTAAGIYDYHGRITDGATATSIVKNGVGTQILNNQSGTPSNYTGSLTINDGIVESVSGSDFPDTSSIIITAGTLNLNYVGTDTIGVLDLGSGPVADGVYDSTDPSGLITGTGSLTVVAPPEPPLVWDGSTDTDWTNPDSTSWSGDTYDDGDDVSFLTAGAGPVNIAATVAPNSVLVNSGADYSFSGSDISGATGLTKSGAGVLTLASANTYAGVTTVTEGRLTVTNAASLGSASGNTVVANNASLSVEGGITVAEALDLTGSGGGTGVLASNGNNTVSGAITLTGGRIETVDGTGKLILSGGVTGTGTILVGDIQVDAPIDFGAGGIQFAGSGINYADPGFDFGNVTDLNVAGNNWDSALLFFDANVRLGVNDAIPTDSSMTFGFVAVDFSTAQLDLNGFDQTLASIETQTLGVGGDVNITGSGTLTLNQNTDTQYEGRLTGGLSLVKNGTGILTLNNLSGTATSYTGDTTINDGTLVMNSPDFANGSTVAITDVGLGVLQLDHGVTDTVAGLTFGTFAQAPGLYNAANSFGYISGTGSILVSSGGGGSYDTWAIANGIPGEPANGDFENDGISNLVEYALGTDPTVSTTPAGVLAGDVITYVMGSDAIANGDVSWVIETSETLALGSWTAQVTQPAGDATPTIAYTLTPGSPVKEFARLKVTQD